MKSDFMLWALLNRSDDFYVAVTRKSGCVFVVVVVFSFVCGGKVLR